MSVPVLEYRRQPDLRTGQPAWLRAIFLVAALLGVASIGLPFYFDVSPWEVAMDLLANPRAGDLLFYSIGLPFFFALPLALWKLRLLIRPCGVVVEPILAAVVFVLALLLAATAAIHCLGQYIEDTPPRDPEMFLGLIALGLHLPWFVIAWLTWRRTRSAEALASCALIGAYLPNAVMCLILFHDGPDIGWWFALVACGGMLAELVVTLILRPAR